MDRRAHAYFHDLLPSANTMLRFLRVSILPSSPKASIRALGFRDRSISGQTNHRPGHIHERRATSRLSTQAHGRRCGTNIVVLLVVLVVV